MQGLLGVFILLSLVLLVAAVVLWVYAAAMAGRLSATQGRVVTLERQVARRMDALSGRLGLLERGGVSAAVAEAPEPASQGAPEPTAQVVAETATQPKPAPEPNASLAAYRRAKDATRAADPTERGADIPVCHPAQPESEEEVEETTLAHASCSAEPVDDEVVVEVTEPAGWHVQPATEEPAPARSAAYNFERLLGGKVYVWIGAIALVLTGAFLLKYGFENDYITEPMRVIAAGVFGVALIGVAQWLRPRAAGQYVQIAQAACGAGVAVLFGTVYAGNALYHLIDPVPAFVLMGAVTAGAVVLSLRFGPLVALLGLVGGFALPPLLGESLPSQPAMVVYLLALELGVLALTRKRGWLGISALTLLGSVAWSLGFVVLGGEAVERGATALLLMGTAVIFVVNTTLVQGRPESEAMGSVDGTIAQKFWLAIGAAGSAAALLAILVVRSGYSGQDVIMLGLMSVGTLVLARLDVRYTLLSWVSFGLGAVVLLSAGLAQWWGMGPAELTVLWRGTIAFGLLFGLGGYAAQWWPTRRNTFALLSALAGPVFLAVAYVGGGWVTGYYDGRAGWWAWALVLSVGYGVLAWPLVRGVLRAGVGVGGGAGTGEGTAAEAASAKRGRAGDLWPASAYALSCVGLAAVAVVFGLNHPWLAVGWAALGAAAGVAGWKLRLPVLTYASAALTAGSAVVLIVPGPFMIDIAGVAIFNTLLVVYMLAALCFGVTAYATHRAGFAALSQPLQGLAVGALAVGCAVLVRDGFHPTAFRAESVLLYEWPTYAVVLMSLGLGVAYAARRLGLSAVGFVATSVGMLGVCLSVVGPVLFGNPLGYETAGGVSLMFGMLYLYALPAALVCLLARTYDRIDEDAVARVLRSVAVVIAAVFVLMQVRNSFNLANLHALRVGFYERATYGLALFALAWGLWSYARVVGSFFTRQAASVVAIAAMGVSVGVMMLVGNPLVDPWLAGGGWLVFGLCYAYLLPAAAGWWFAQLQHPQAAPGHARLLRLGGVLLVTGFVGLQVRNGFHLADLHAIRITLYEWATYGLCWMLLGGVFALVGWRTGLHDAKRLLIGSGLAVGLLGVATALAGTWLIANPLWTRNAVGATPVANGLWYLYGPTILALAVLARILRRYHLTPWARAAGGASIALGFGLLSLLVRQGFSTDGVLHFALVTTDSEWYAYSLAWVVYGIGLLVAGIATKLETLRYGSLAVMLLAVAKVFALDTAGLEDLLRVFSFLGLGVTLLLLGYTYQRFVFRKPTTSDAQPEAKSTGKALS